MNNELRLGNWVYNDENKPVKMVVIETDEFAEWNGSDCSCMFLEDGSYKYSVIHPIPLTPEILEKAGFVKISACWQFEDYNDAKCIGCVEAGSIGDCLKELGISLNVLEQYRKSRK